MNKTLLSIIAGTLITGCSTGKTWKSACRDIDIHYVNNCLLYTREWIKEANSQGYDADMFTYFPDGRPVGHCVAYMNGVFIDPLIGWKTYLTKDEIIGGVWEQ